DSERPPVPARHRPPAQQRRAEEPAEQGAQDPDRHGAEAAARVLAGHHQLRHGSGDQTEQDPGQDAHTFANLKPETSSFNRSAACNSSTLAALIFSVAADCFSASALTSCALAACASAVEPTRSTVCSMVSSTPMLSSATAATRSAASPTCATA